MQGGVHGRQRWRALWQRTGVGTPVHCVPSHLCFLLCQLAQQRVGLPQQHTACSSPHIPCTSLLRHGPRLALCSCTHAPKRATASIAQACSIQWPHLLLLLLALPWRPPLHRPPGHSCLPPPGFQQLRPPGPAPRLPAAGRCCWVRSRTGGSPPAADSARPLPWPAGGLQAAMMVPGVFSLPTLRGLRQHSLTHSSYCRASKQFRHDCHSNPPLRLPPPPPPASTFQQAMRQPASRGVSVRQCCCCTAHAALGCQLQASSGGRAGAD
jgi:hypothetical protein